MAVLQTGQSFSSGDQVTSQKLMDIADLATFRTGANQTADDSTIQVDGSGGYLKVKSAGISSNQLADDSVTENKIQDGAVTAAKVADSAVSLSKIENIATAKVIGRTTAGTGTPELVSILDEDNMASDSATSIATQQSIKAYVDSVFSGVPTFYAFSSGAITTEAQHTINYPSGWTGGAPDKVLVSTRYPTGDGSSQQWFQVVSFTSTSVTVFAQSQSVSSFTAIYADILLVKN
jgi:hypothetical protein